MATSEGPLQDTSNSWVCDQTGKVHVSVTQTSYTVNWGPSFCEPGSWYAVQVYLHSDSLAWQWTTLVCKGR